MKTENIIAGVTLVTYNNPEDPNDVRTGLVGKVVHVFTDQCVRVEFEIHGKVTVFGCKIDYLTQVNTEEDKLPSIIIKHANKAVLQVIVDKVKTMKGIEIETTGF